MGRFKQIKIIGLLLVFFLLTKLFPAYAQDPAISNGDSLTTQNQYEAISCQVNGTKLNFESLVIINDRLMIAFADLEKVLTCQVEWLPPNQIIITATNTKMVFSIGQLDYMINTTPKQFDVYPYVTEAGLILVPIRPIAEAFDYKVEYDPSTRILMVNSFDYLASIDTVIPEIDFQALPTWGSMSQTPDLMYLWQQEDIIAGYYTRLINSPAGRTTNVQLSANKIDGKILNPGEAFSFNQTVGPRTSTTGFQNAKIFAGKKIVDGIGGGICQTSSTVYNAALEAGLKIIERYPHSMQVAYAPPGRDATVSWGSADFKFQNNMDFPIKILCKVENSLVFAAIARVVPPAPSTEPAPTPVEANQL